MRVHYLRKKRDKYTKLAKQEGYRSRAAYKILQIDKKFKIFHPNQIVIDLCGAPGGFSQVARDITQGRAKIFLVDLSKVKPFPKITEIIKGDITKRSTLTNLQKSVEKLGIGSQEIVVLSDCSPNVSGHWSTDHARQIWLAEVSLGIANYFLADKFLTKVFQGELLEEFSEKIKRFYSKTKVFKPQSSRKQSSETYILATERKLLEKRRFNESYLVLEDDS